MRKLFLIGTGLLVLACSEYRVDSMEEDVLCKDNEGLSMEECVKLQAIEFYQSLTLKTRGCADNVEIADVYPWKREDYYSTITRTKFSIEELPETLMYVVNFKNNKGFVLVSADTSNQVVYAYVEHGAFHVYDDIEGTGFDFYLGALLYNLSLSTRTSHSPRPPFYPGGTWTIDTIIPVFLPVNWGQEAPYNWRCPIDTVTNGRCKAGCVAVAIGQLLTKHRYPSSYKGHTYDWTIITDDTIPQYTEAQLAVAQLLADIGTSLNMKYRSTVSTCTHLDVKLCLDSLGYNHSILDTISFDICMTEFYYGRPLYIKGQRVVGNDTVGHAWVADGGLVRSMYVYMESPNGIMELIRANVQHLLHCNWGNNGDYNGYFVVDALKPDEEEAYFNVGMIHHIYPSE